MLHSMTGYGKTEISLPDKKIIIEIKSLNSKTIDTYLRIPSVYREKELVIRKLIQDSLKRGKIECSIHYELIEGSTTTTINSAVFRNYYKQLNELQEELNIQNSDFTSAILKLPDTIKTNKMELNNKEWSELEKGIKKALAHLNQFRAQEGKAMEKDLLSHVDNILELKNSVTPFENNRIAKLKERIKKSLDEFLQNEQADKNRFEQEMIFYIEKLDVSEEKIRLLNHCNYFKETLEHENETGKKLSFIAQEMGREINTLGSKANDSDIQHIVVKMKDELEKIKEQVLNTL